MDKSRWKLMIFCFIHKKGLPQIRKQKCGKMVIILHIKDKWLRVWMKFVNKNSSFVFKNWSNMAFLFRYLVIKKGLPQTRKQKYGKMFAPLHIKGKWLRVGMNFASGKAPLVFQKWHSALLLPNDLQTNETEWLAAVTHRCKVSTIY